MCVCVFFFFLFMIKRIFIYGIHVGELALQTVPSGNVSSFAGIWSETKVVNSVKF